MMQLQDQKRRAQLDQMQVQAKEGLEERRRREMQPVLTEDQIWE